MAVVYMAVVYVVLTVLAGYFLGCVNGALLVSKYILHDDVRDHGSGNAGLTNFHRVFGGKLTIVVVLCDMLKAVCAVLVGQLLMGHFLGLVVLGKYVAGLSCMLGHMFPCMFHFKGGKGILSGVTVALMLDWRIGLFVFGIFLVAYLLTKYVSLGSVLSSGSFGFFYAWIHWGEGWFPIAVGLFLSCLIVWMHRSNIVRLLKGEERKTNLFGKGSKT